MALWSDLVSEGVERYNSLALEDGHQISTVQSILFGFDGRNTDTGNPAYIMVFDTATAPTGASIPVITIAVAAAAATANGNGNFSYQAPLYGIKFKKGIYIASSSTDALTYTATVTSSQAFHVQFAFEDGSTNPA